MVEKINFTDKELSKFSELEHDLGMQLFYNDDKRSPVTRALREAFFMGMKHKKN